METIRVRLDGGTTVECDYWKRDELLDEEEFYDSLRYIGVCRDCDTMIPYLLYFDIEGDCYVVTDIEEVD